MIIDSHIHYSLPVKAEEIIEILDKTQTDYCCLVSQLDSHRASETLDSLLAKSMSDRIYVFGSLDATNYYKDIDNLGINMSKHVEELMACGCDGIKMLEGKPTTRLRYPIPDFDNKCWDPYFDYLEKKQIPVVWHVNDPEEFWDREKVPAWALANGWFYADTKINNQSQYKQIENVLERHPMLKITFAHFFFLSNDLNRLGKLFDKFPNICVDITPGIEMFINFSKNIEKSREFFIKYQDRILYGTDICGCGCEGDLHFNEKDSLIRSNLCRKVLSEKDDILIKGDKESLFGEEDLLIKSLQLDKEVQEKILYKNFLRNVSQRKEINSNKILEECQRERNRIKFLAKVFNYEENYEVIDYIENIFKDKK